MNVYTKDTFIANCFQLVVVVEHFMATLRTL